MQEMFFMSEQSVSTYEYSYK